MEVGTWAGVITAVATLFASVGGLILAVKTIIPTHKIVNQQRTDMERFQTVLINTLKSHGITVPDDQSKVQPMVTPMVIVTPALTPDPPAQP